MTDYFAKPLKLQRLKEYVNLQNLHPAIFFLINTYICLFIHLYNQTNSQNKYLRNGCVRNHDQFYYRIANKPDDKKKYLFIYLSSNPYLVMCMHLSTARKQELIKKLHILSKNGHIVM